MGPANHSRKRSWLFIKTAPARYQAMKDAAGVSTGVKWKAMPRKSVHIEEIEHPALFLTNFNMAGAVDKYGDLAKEWRLRLYQCQGNSLFCLSRGDEGAAPEPKVKTIRSNINPAKDSNTPSSSAYGVGKKSDGKNIRGVLTTATGDNLGGRDFATGRINLGEIQVVKVIEFDRVWKCGTSRGKSTRASFYKPVGIPEGFHCLGHYCQPNKQPLQGFVLAARANDPDNHSNDHLPPPLKKPVDYTLVWSSDSDCNFWLPNPPAGYKAVGVIVTDGSEQPEVEEVRCVREDLTESCETGQMILGVGSFNVWTTEPSKRGIWSRGVSVGSFFCSTNDDPSSRNSIAAMNIACLKNLDQSLQAMPNLDQVHALIHHYGPTVYFHPEETYMPSSVPCFFKNGALLYRFGKSQGEPVNSSGSNLPAGGENDGTFWIDLSGEDDEEVKKGNLESSELYVHVKPALGGIFTDIVLFSVALVSIQLKGSFGFESSKEAYVTLLYGDEFLLGVRVLGKSIRDTGSSKDMVALVSDGVSDYSKKLLKADGWKVEKICLLANPNQVHPTRFWGVYTKLKIFNMTDYKKAVYLDAYTIVVKNIEDLFKCSKFCANLKHSERLNSGVMVVEPSEALFNDMMRKVKTLSSYTGGDQGFLNSYYPDFPNARVFDPSITPEALKTRPVPEMERLSTLYNADVGLYMLANKV